MAREMFGRTEGRSQLSTHTSPQTGKRILTQPRSQRYLTAIRGLDGKSAVSDVDVSLARIRLEADERQRVGGSDDEIAHLRDEIGQEFAASGSMYPAGLIAHCYLGGRFEVHTVTWGLTIIAHFKRGEPLPDNLERARHWAESTAYFVIEVYDDHVACVRDDGSVVKVEM